MTKLRTAELVIIIAVIITQSMVSCAVISDRDKELTYLRQNKVMLESKIFSLEFECHSFGR